MSADALKTERQGVAARVLDAAMDAAHLTHEACNVKSFAEAKVEDAVHEAKRALRRGSEKLEDLRDNGIHYVKRQPLTSIAIAAGLGFMVGVTASWILRRVRA
jgi:ElaB/YqjD/DUF883 family membrane-anchored ribosome-binding protein